MQRKQRLIEAAMGRLENGELRVGRYDVVVRGAPWNPLIGGRFIVVDKDGAQLYTTRTKGGQKLGDRALLRVLNFLREERRTDRMMLERERMNDIIRTWEEHHEGVPRSEIQAILMDRLEECGVEFERTDYGNARLTHNSGLAGLRTYQTCLAIVRDTLPLANVG